MLVAEAITEDQSSFFSRLWSKIWDYQTAVDYWIKDSELVEVGYDIYWEDYKNEVLLPRLKKLRAQWVLGESVIDVGSSMVDFVRKATDWMLYYSIDLFWTSSFTEDWGHVSIDLNALRRTTSACVRGLIRKAIASVRPTNRHKVREWVDSMVCVDVLNYLDFEDVLRRLAHLIKPGGHLIIWNEPDYGHIELFHSKRPRSNEHLVEVMQALGFELVEWLEEMREDRGKYIERAIDLQTLQWDLMAQKLMQKSYFWVFKKAG